MKEKLEKKSQRIFVRLTEKEKSQLKDKAEKENKTLSEYIKDKVLK